MRHAEVDYVKSIAFIFGLSLLLCGCSNLTEPVINDSVLWSSSFEINGSPSLETWQVIDSSTAHSISFSSDVPPFSGRWSLSVPLDSSRIYSLHEDILIASMTANCTYILTYRAKCIGRGGALAGLGILTTDSMSYNHYDFVSNSGWSVHCDTIITPSRAVLAEVAICVQRNFSRTSVDELLHPVQSDTNAVLFDDFRLVQHKK